ncbi:substrate-binding periplasmic protein [Desulfovibrio inopinatus]|uniref:substrate-binding periplasmic protein n=1 Tax=Desulfovibrio inopinatus TaxID=102109 RepID=UPI00040284B2|nr:transporter substrate-binding domain-containing protein [Desulfovibrio inopinatus]
MRHLVIIPVFLLLYLVLFQSSPIWADTIILTADTWCPFNCSPRSSKPGYAVEIAKRIFKKAGHKVIYTVKPWKTAIEDVQSGKDTGIIGTTKAESNDFIFPDEPIGRPRNTFFVRKNDHWTYSSPESLDSKRLGIIKYYDYGTALNTYIYANLGTDAIVISEGKKALKNNFKLLMDKKIDVLAEDSNVGTYTALKMGILNKVAQVNAGSPPVDIFIAFSPQNPKSKTYADIFDKGLRELRSSGRLARILKRYGQQDWE